MCFVKLYFFLWTPPPTTIDTIDYVTGIGNSIQRARPKCVTGCCAHAHSFPGSSFCCAQIRTTEAACAMAEMLTDVPAIAGR